MEPKSVAGRLAVVEGTPGGLIAAPDSGMTSGGRDISLRSRSSTSPLAFDDFYNAHAAAIGKALRLTLGDPELAEDALNEAMARALQRWKRVAHYNNAPGWVYRVAMNWALSWLRRRRRERERPLTVATQAVPDITFDNELQQALETLSIDHRAVVVCRFFLDWSVAQTANSLDIPEGTVKSRVARALDNIRIELEREE